MGSKCAVQNLGQGGGSTSPLLSLSVVQCFFLVLIKLCSHMTVYLSSLLKVCDFSTSLSLTSVLKQTCLSGLRMSSRLHFCLHPSLSFLLIRPHSSHFFDCLSAFTVAYTLRQIAQYCMSVWPQSPSYSFSHTYAYILSLTHTQKFISLFTVYFAFEQGVRLCKGREETFLCPSFFAVGTIRCCTVLCLSPARQESKD